ncbi:heavy metal-associated isoprenylated plant protein 27-like [Nymphaea colorata]|nr:heavy metal-associated isoprenylated plant protein 27-like [Nymphaea colorata]XP_031477339.1 heavy metal-associated isoprenylated plant protein 27-like [Nymphaea colorata]
MDCDGCERKVKKSIEGMKGVTSIEINRKPHKLTVEGYVEPNKVVERVRKKTGKPAELWPYVPYKLVTQPYAAGTYDKKAPPGYVRDVAAVETPNPDETGLIEEQFTSAFSDENPNACTLM